MGYPMSYDRVVNRNHLTDDYSTGPEGNRLICGDLRRLEKDTQDEIHIRSYAAAIGATEDQVRMLFTLFFAGTVRRLYQPTITITAEQAKASEYPEDSSHGR